MDKMMKTRLLLSLSLLAALLAACTSSAAPAVPDQPALSGTTEVLPMPTLEQASQPAAGPAQDLSPTPQAVATSRGPDLHATDPSTVTLASGNLHFVEFFRFT
jgi:hypothetical protein